MAKDDEPIQILAGLKAKDSWTATLKGRVQGWDSATGAEIRNNTVLRHSGRMTVEFTVPDIAFTMDDRKAAATYAAVLEKVAQQNLGSGLDLNGRPLPGADSATINRRKYRLEQAQRGGMPSAKFGRDISDRVVAEHIRHGRSPSKTAANNARILKAHSRVLEKARKNFVRRFSSAQIGMTPPDASLGGGRSFGIESGLLAKSIKVVVEEGGRFVMYFAGTRAFSSGGGAKSAVARVFQRIGLFTAEGLRQPGIQEGLVQLKKDLFQSRLERGRKLLSELAGQARDLVQRAEDAAEVDASE